LSPRRAALLKSLTIEELEVLKTDPRFFFGGPAFEESAEPSLSSMASVSAGNSQASVMRPPSHPAESPVEELIFFFTPLREEKDAPVEVYVKRLRAKLAAPAASGPPTPAASQSGRLGAGASTGSLPLSAVADTLLRWGLVPSTSEGKGADSSLMESRLESSPASCPPQTQERMPCQGRRPAVRKDAASPTLKRMREINNKREATDIRLAEERREAMAQREARNLQRAQEQQEELQREAQKTQEMLKVRRADAKERKQQLDAEAAERAELANVDAMEKMLHAEERSFDMSEQRRQKALDTLETWSHGVDRADAYLRRVEHDTIAKAEQSWSNYMDKIWRLGVSRHTQVENSMEASNSLKAAFQTSLVQKIKEEQLQKSAAIDKAMHERLEAASLRRQTGQMGTRYNFVEKAFGPQASSFDLKSHTVSIDRRKPAWKKNAASWARVSGTFSEPSLSQTFS